MARLTLENITKRFGEVVAVNELSLEVDDGEFVVFVGPSGCGKSTTLRMIAGLEEITDGKLSIDETVVNDLEPPERNVAMVFQNYALYPHMTARRNMTFGMNSSGSYTDEEIDERVSNAAEMLDIVDLLERKPANLSGGERQRVAIGRALVRQPDVFLLDEPLSNLDAKLRVQMRSELSELHSRLQTTTVYVTHDQVEALTLGDRVAVMNEGQLEQVAAPQELYDFPKTQFVAGFIGSPAMNMIQVNVVHAGGRVYAESNSFRIPLSRADPSGVPEQRAILGVRPEDIHLADELDNEADRIPTDIRITEPLGETLLAYSDIDGTEIKFKTEPHQPMDNQSQVELTFNPDRLHLFDAESGEAIHHTQPPKAENELTINQS
ncbi:ABC transporter ATP-binding protein [Saliphagus infecundisoli]|uniref:ABC-type D-xylose/L-arabinose transporter n=1 Tax=Saliphagus infecundisoli TaxID=1849069 RepID=A0ABD5QAZ3_9EURY|nr:sn-glycerol-3-phosphate ABC transporter ATP-binding protein UgpC [Saliphagus infecundisoli]